MPPSESPSVAELLTQAGANKQRALGQLFERCRNYLLLVARAQVDSWLQAKVGPSDLVQQSLLEAYRDFAHFQGHTEGEWLAWLRQILLRNVADCVRHYHGTEKRQVGREITLDGPLDSSGVPTGGPTARGETPSQQLLRKERELLVAEAMTRLAPDHSEVIFLRNLQRLSFEEVAQHMGRSRPAAQMLWTRAMRSLQQTLTRVGDGP